MRRDFRRRWRMYRRRAARRAPEGSSITNLWLETNREAHESYWAAHPWLFCAVVALVVAVLAIIMIVFPAFAHEVKFKGINCAM